MIGRGLPDGVEDVDAVGSDAVLAITDGERVVVTFVSGACGELRADGDGALRVVSGAAVIFLTLRTDGLDCEQQASHAAFDLPQGIDAATSVHINLQLVQGDWDSWQQYGAELEPEGTP